LVAAVAVVAVSPFPSPAERALVVLVVSIREVMDRVQMVVWVALLMVVVAVVVLV
jgi:hypothetical protein